MVAMRLGIADHLGWAVVVAASADGKVADRRRIELVEDGVPNMPIHHDSKHLSLDDTAALVARVRASVARAASAACDELAATLSEPIGSVSMRALPANFPDDIATQCCVPYEARADAVMYRQVLVELADARGWKVRFYEAKSVVGLAEHALGARAGEVLDGPRATLGPPWAKDHRMALAALIIA